MLQEERHPGWRKKKTPQKGVSTKLYFRWVSDIRELFSTQPNTEISSNNPSHHHQVASWELFPSQARR
jgi:hypothetical protein